MAADAQVCCETAVIEAPAVQSLLSNTENTKFSDVGSEESEFDSEKNVNSESVVNGVKDSSDAKSDYKMQDIVDMLKKLKLNPQAKEFVPSYYNRDQMFLNNFVHNFVPVIKTVGADVFQNNGKRGNNHNQGRRRMNNRAFKAQREDSIRRTVYVSDIDHNITEERLAALFSAYGQEDYKESCNIQKQVGVEILNYRVHSSKEHHFAYSARASLSLCGTILGFCPLKVLPSKTAILPVNPTFLPRSEDEREMCARTVYCTNIDKKLSQADVKNFFETRCGEVSRLRLLGDQVHSTRIAFVEFVMAESAILALDCCGQILGSQRIRVSPSKTPVRPRVPRPMMH